MKDKCSTIEALNNRVQGLEEQIAQRRPDDSSQDNSQTKDKEIYDLQVDIAYLEKSKQDLEVEVSQSNDQIVKMHDVWTQDKDRLINTESMYHDVQLQLKDLSQKLGETQSQLKEMQSLSEMKKEVGPHQISTGKEDEQGDLASGPELNIKIAQAAVIPVEQEICMYELIEPGKCRRKEKCKFSHKILPHMREETWMKAKIDQLSDSRGRCVLEMVKKGSCQKKNECTHPHLKDQNNPAKKVCFREIEKPGSCPKREKCRFSHQISDSDRQNPELKRQADLHKNSSQWICVNEYRQEHSCRKKDKCGYRHIISEEERKSSSLQEAMKQKWERIITKSNSVDKESTDQSSKEELPKPFMEEFRAFMSEWRTLASRPGSRP